MVLSDTVLPDIAECTVETQAGIGLDRSHSMNKFLKTCREKRNKKKGTGINILPRESKDIQYDEARDATQEKSVMSKHFDDLTEMKRLIILCRQDKSSNLDRDQSTSVSYENDGHSVDNSTTRKINEFFGHSRNKKFMSPKNGPNDVKSITEEDFAPSVKCTTDKQNLSKVQPSESMILEGISRGTCLTLPSEFEVLQKRLGNCYQSLASGGVKIYKRCTTLDVNTVSDNDDKNGERREIQMKLSGVSGHYLQSLTPSGAEVLDASFDLYENNDKAHKDTEASPSPDSDTVKEVETVTSYSIPPPAPITEPPCFGLNVFLSGMTDLVDEICVVAAETKVARMGEPITFVQLKEMEGSDQECAKEDDHGKKGDNQECIKEGDVEKDEDENKGTNNRKEDGTEPAPESLTVKVQKALIDLDETMKDLEHKLDLSSFEKDDKTETQYEEDDMNTFATITTRASASVISDSQSKLSFIQRITSDDLSLKGSVRSRSSIMKTISKIVLKRKKKKAPKVHNEEAVQSVSSRNSV